MSEDRPRKSWKDIDKQRDGGAQRRDSRSEPRQDPRRQKSYRAKLDRLFDSGKIGEFVEQKSEAAGEGSGDASQLKLLREIRDAEGRATITKAVDTYLADHELPMDADILAKVLEHRNPSRQLDAMEALLVLIESEKPRRTRAIVGQLKLIRDTTDETDLQDLATKLLDRLE